MDQLSSLSRVLAQLSDVYCSLHVSWEHLVLVFLVFMCFYVLSNDFNVVLFIIVK